ncbi:MAG: heme-binding protein, partial [Verrucomicrobiales bacterium]|nr:heme-binding protein [Verrucomicrobiales bacterium]
MKRLIVLLTACNSLFTSMAAAQAEKASDSSPKWLWIDRDAKSETIFGRRAFTIASLPQTAKLSITCDNGFIAFVNGTRVGNGNEWEKRYEFDVKKHLQVGDNVLAVKATNEGSKGGLVAKLMMTHKNSKADVVVTDSQWWVSRKAHEGWQAPSINTEDWQRPVLLGKMGIAPWGNVFAKAGSRNKESSATASEATVHPKGFKVEKIYDVPKAEQGSWVSMTIDDEGRLYCSDQGGKGLFRVILGQGNQAPKIERLPLQISGAHGLLWAFNSLYVCVNEGSFGGHKAGLYRITDSNGDGDLDKITSLRKLQGSGEHGPHAVVLSPDGESLYVVGGNHTKPPLPETSAVVSNYDEDQLLPRSPDARGHAAKIRAPGGWIAKTDPEGKSWEMFCSGFRNQYDVAFNADGEMFTYDSDMEWDSGMPWYRPTRIYHCTSGAEYGWRTGTGKWPSWYPDALPPAIDIGPGCPTGVVSGLGAKFPAKYQQAIYAFDWTYGTIYALHLRPRGGSYLAEKEEFVTGVPLNVTDGVIGKDGNFYFAVGGRGTTSALYRVSYEGEAPTKTVKIGNKKGRRERELRRQLEQFHGKQDANAISVAWPHLSH